MAEMLLVSRTPYEERNLTFEPVFCLSIIMSFLFLSYLFRDCLNVMQLSALSGELGCACAGLAADAALLVDCARTLIANHWFKFGAQPSPRFVASELGSAALSFSNTLPLRSREEEKPLRIGRPLGAALLVAGANVLGGGGGEGGDGEGRGGTGWSSAAGSGALYHVDPTGSVRRWRAKAIGTGSRAADQELARGLLAVAREALDKASTAGVPGAARAAGAAGAPEETAVEGNEGRGKVKEEDVDMVKAGSARAQARLAPTLQQAARIAVRALAAAVPSGEGGVEGEGESADEGDHSCRSDELARGRFVKGRFALAVADHDGFKVLTDAEAEALLAAA